MTDAELQELRIALTSDQEGGGLSEASRIRAMQVVRDEADRRYRATKCPKCGGPFGHPNTDACYFFNPAFV